MSNYWVGNFRQLVVLNHLFNNIKIKIVYIFYFKKIKLVAQNKSSLLFVFFFKYILFFTRAYLSFTQNNSHVLKEYLQFYYIKNILNNSNNKKKKTKCPLSYYNKKFIPKCKIEISSQPNPTHFKSGLAHFKLG